MSLDSSFSASADIPHPIPFSAQLSHTPFSYRGHPARRRQSQPSYTPLTSYLTEGPLPRRYLLRSAGRVRGGGRVAKWERALDNRSMEESRSVMPPLGLIAGQGTLPLETARGIRALGRAVVCVALAGQARIEELRGLCDKVSVVGLLRMNQWIRVLKRHGCREAVMVGRVGKRDARRFHLFRYMPDWRAARSGFSG